MNKILFIAPHPDDETLGCGGTILRHKACGDEIHWLIITGMIKDYGWSAKNIEIREKEIELVKNAYKFNKVHKLNFPAASLDQIKTLDLVEKIGAVMKLVEPNIVYMPFRFDVHSDHRITAKAVQSCIKRFRRPYICKVLMYESISETDQNFTEGRPFRPNVFINIDNFIDQKIDIMNIYASEVGEHPFPRSENSIRALSILRGSNSFNEAAEAFELVFECQ
jgi:LmbE family N-acetylglucosaminyl deacetylase